MFLATQGKLPTTTTSGALPRPGWKRKRIWSEPGIAETPIPATDMKISMVPLPR